jgi:BolA protein
MTEAFAPESVRVIDESHQHEGHAGHRPGGESHFLLWEPLAAPPHDRSFRCYRISSPNSPFLGARRCGGPYTIAPIATKRIGAIRAIINRILYVIGPPGPHGCAAPVGGGGEAGAGSGAEQSDRPQETGQGAGAAGRGVEGGLRETIRCQSESGRTPAAILSRLLAFQVLMCGSSCRTTFNNELCQVAVVINKAQLPKFVHERTHPRSRRADHLRQRLLPLEKERYGPEPGRNVPRTGVPVVGAGFLFKAA